MKVNMPSSPDEEFNQTTSDFILCDFKKATLLLILTTVFDISVLWSQTLLTE